MTEDIETLVGVVDRLNAKFHVALSKNIDDTSAFKFITDGEEQAVTFMGITIWRSDPDDRIPPNYDWDGNDPQDLEDIETFVRTKAIRLVLELNQFCAEL